MQRGSFLTRIKKLQAPNMTIKQEAKQAMLVQIEET